MRLPVAQVGDPKIGCPRLLPQDLEHLPDLCRPGDGVQDPVRPVLAGKRRLEEVQRLHPAHPLERGPGSSPPIRRRSRPCTTVRSATAHKNCLLDDTQCIRQARTDPIIRRAGGGAGTGPSPGPRRSRRGERRVEAVDTVVADGLRGRQAGKETVQKWIRSAREAIRTPEHLRDKALNLAPLT